MTSWKPLIIPGSLLLATLAACAHVPATHYYVLQSRQKDAGSPGMPDAGTRPVIGVEHFEVDPPYDQDRIIYRIGEDSSEIGYYDYHRWAAPLSRMLPGIVASALGDSTSALVLEPAATKRDYDAILDGRVRAFEEIDTPSGPQVEIRIELILRTRDGAPLWARTVGGRRALQTKSVGDLVSLMRSLLEDSLQQTVAGLVTALRQHDDEPEARPSPGR
jgi:uncharacterized lipoprotein YmbA